jgi:hypothetical protein
MADRPEITVEILIEHWRRQGRKLTDAGVPLERVVASLREASLEAESEWFCVASLPSTCRSLASLSLVAGKLANKSPVRIAKPG